MGITWRHAMPLLSTLAALVIIVHSAEENWDREHRYDLKPRVLDTRPSDVEGNEQPWRLIRSEPMQHAVPDGALDYEAQDERPIRRRVGRKRKRRPPSPSDLEENDPIPEETKPHRGEDDIVERSTETPKRRKKHRNTRWNDDATESRPNRRRGQRRKRPSLDTWPELSEFGVYPRSKKLLESNREAIIQTDIDEDDVGNQQYSQRDNGDDDDEREIKIHNRRPAPESRFVMADENQKQYNKIREDKSLSEFSEEIMNPHQPMKSDGEEYDLIELRDKIQEKSPGIFHTVDKAKEPEPIDAFTLKDILKKSNGTSLSEILQQHNLTLADLLNGKENAISILKAEKSLHDSLNSTSIEENPTKNGNGRVDIKDDVTTTAPLENIEVDYITKQKILLTDQYSNTNYKSIRKDNKIDTTTIKYDTLTQEKPTEDVISLPEDSEPEEIVIQNENSTTIPKMEQRKSGMLTRRRFPGTIRRKLRMRPTVNNTYKSQINRDLIALSARRYVHHNRRNATKGKEWRDMIPLMVNLNITKERKQRKENSSVTTTSVPEETTTIIDTEEPIQVTVSDEPITIKDEPITISNVTYDANNDIDLETTTIAVEILATELDVSVTETSIVTRPSINPSGQRRQSFNNRLKKKRIKQKTSTTEAPQNDIMKNLLELGDLVSSSEFIARTQLPKATSPDDYSETVTELEDFMTTQAVSKSTVRPSRIASTRKIKLTTVTKSPLKSSTEETAKIEIEEILNDTHSSAKLSKILRERNMTLSELLEHRERGSSHVHLADIFHNASREPNPPEPFLSKSLIEPISKETYPLRALLDANLHEPQTKATTVDSILTNHVNIPVIMDFGNNVNENAENMGIMSLFNNFTKKAAMTTESIDENITLQKDSTGTPYKTTIISVNATDDDDPTRESRMLDDNQDMISWNEIFTMIRKNHKNETKTLEKLTNEISPSGTYKKITLEEDVDGDGVIVLEDLHRRKETDNNMGSGSDEKIEFNTLERAEILEPGILTKPPNSAKSVTVATASIVGLAMILFLLTYAALKWRQQRSISHKKQFCDDRIPSPVFENRKGTKNCSSRSISPMLPTSNIYTMNTLDSQNGKDSPEYMWDTLRKPFQ